MNPKRASFNCRSYHGFILLGIWGLVGAIMLSGCTGSYGRLNWDPQVTAAFQDRDIQQGFNYYYCGVGNQTFAIAGISTEYNVESIMWREVPQDTEAFSGLVSRAWENHHYKRS